MGIRLRPLSRRFSTTSLEGALLQVLSIAPTTNYALADPTERADQMVSLSRVLQGISHPAQFLSTACAVDGQDHGWLNPPRIERSWSAVTETGAGVLGRALRGMRLECDEVAAPPIEDFAVRGDGPAVDADCVQLADGDFASSVVLRRWPREVAPGWLGHALSNLAFPVSVGIHVQPQDPLRLARFLRRQQSWQTDTGLTHDAANALGRTDAERVREKLIARTDRPCKAAVVLTTRARDRATMRDQLLEVKSEMTLALADVRDAKFEQDRAFLATQSTGACKVIGAWRTLDCTSVASTWMFQPVTINHRNGASLGVTHDASMLVRLDPFDESLRSFSGLLTGSIGSGKSYFLKLLLRHLDPRVEKHLVEHSDPPEYDGIPGLLTTNLVGLTEAEQAQRLREYIANLWDLAHRDPRPRLLVIDELWSVLKRPELNARIEEIARRGRKYGLALWIATQQVEELLESGKPVFDNAAVKVYLQQEDRDLAGLARAANLSTIARQTLRSAARGQALIQCGKMTVLVDVQASAAEHPLITTDPRELWGHLDVSGNARDDVPNSHAPDDVPEIGSAGRRVDGVWLPGPGSSGSTSTPVAAARQ
jgi:hypothetical protein